ncbi:hypothetical protein Acr_05g0004740 [Actinidia rufa]|uniref:Uncharacterized protein n=1 Tax=Actinidia rufa TaxID=165716 RepID=A0A7J0EK39_9ERIC|nr:hypothetical protein Acr_05g0004740 [Actinidia rufa]
MEESIMPCPCHYPEKHPRRSTRWWFGLVPPAEELVFGLSYLMAISLWQVPMEYIDGNPVPAVVFHGKPTMFHAFVVGLCLSFSGSIGALELRKRSPKVAAYYKVFAIGAMAVTVAVLLWAAVPAAFGWFVSSFVQCCVNVWHNSYWL